MLTSAFGDGPAAASAFAKSPLTASAKALRPTNPDHHPIAKK
jgi:hypothetical protein